MRFLKCYIEALDPFVLAHLYPVGICHGGASLSLLHPRGMLLKKSLIDLPVDPTWHKTQL